MISNNKNQFTLVKKTRRKPIKSCLYCRTKKLKCDRKKPKCSSCISRNLTECLYLDKNKSVSNHSIVQLEEKLVLQKAANITCSFNNNTYGSESHLSCNTFDKKQNKQKESNPDIVCTKSLGSFFPGMTTITDSSDKNPLYMLECVSVKKTRVMYYGPTSVKSILTNMCSTTFPPFFKILKEFKKFRKTEKSKTNFTMMKELLLLDATRHGTVFQEIVEVLPDFTTFRTCVEYYFDTLYYKFFPFLHKKVVLQYLDTVLIIDKKQNKILGFNHPDRRNYYPAAILLSLFSITYYSTDIPDILLKWFVYLEGCSTTKSLTFERAQFLLLKVIYRLYNGFTGGDLSHIEILVASLCKTSMSLGLYRNYTHFYPQETLDKIGGVEIVNNIWYWTLYYDILIGFETGKGLIVGDKMCDDELLLKNEGCSRNTTLLKKYILLCRSILIDVLKPKGMPNLSQNMLKISDFLDENFLKVSNYMDEVKCNIVEPFDYLLIVPVLDKFLTFAYFQYYFFDNKLVEIENDIVRCSVILIGISACFINMCLKYEQNHIKPVACRAKSNIILGEGLKSIACMRSNLLLFHLLRRCDHERLDPHKIENTNDLYVQGEIDSFELAKLTCKTTKKLTTKSIFNLFCSASEKLLQHEISALQQLTTMYIFFTYQSIMEKIVLTFLVTNYRHLTLLKGHTNSLTTFALSIAKNDKNINILKNGTEYSEGADQVIVNTNDENVSLTTPFPNISNDTVFDKQFYQYFNCSETEFFDLLNSDLKDIIPE